MDTALPIETVQEDDDLRVRWLEGQSRTLVVAFTGMMHQFAGQPMDEFARSAHNNGQNNVLFISDLNQSWFSRPGLWDRIVRLVRDVIELERIETVISLGNSMGGFGAMLLPRDIKVRRALAFAPQVSMDRAVIKEDRWVDAQWDFGTLPVSNIADTIDATGTHYFVTVSANAPRDLAQVDLLPRDHARVNVFALPSGSHNIAERLKSAGLLHRVIHQLIRGRRRRVEALYQEFCAWIDAPQPQGDLP